MTRSSRSRRSQERLQTAQSGSHTTNSQRADRRHRKPYGSLHAPLATHPDPSLHVDADLPVPSALGEPKDSEPVSATVATQPSRKADHNRSDSCTTGSRIQLQRHEKEETERDRDPLSPCFHRLLEASAPAGPWRRLDTGRAGVCCRRAAFATEAISFRVARMALEPFRAGTAATTRPCSWWTRRAPTRG